MNQLDPSKSSTYISPTHYDEDIPRTVPGEIGIMFTPMPRSVITPATSLMQGDIIPRCGQCAAFINKYCKITQNRFTCSLCDTENILSVCIDPNSVELNDEVYECYVQNKYMVRQSLVATDFHIISASLLKTFPNFFDGLANAYGKVTSSRQIGIAVLKGGLTAAIFRPNLQLQTFADDIPPLTPSKMFANIPLFKASINILKEKLYNLPDCSIDNGPKNAMYFAYNVGMKFGSAVIFWLDETDYNIACQGDYKDISMLAASSGSEISFHVFGENLSHGRTCAEVAAITGGRFQFVNKPDFSFINRYVMHDAFLFGRGPNISGIADYAGEGFLKNDRGVVLAKVGINQTFYFTFHARKFKYKYIQFALFYTTEMSNRKIRVFTFPFPKPAAYSDYIIDRYAAGMVANSLLIEDVESAKELLKKLKQRFNETDLRTGTNLFTFPFPRIYEAAIAMRDGVEMNYIDNSNDTASA